MFETKSVGIDIQPDSVRIAVVSQQGGRTRVLNLFVKEIPQASGHEARDAAVSAIRSALDESGTGADMCVASRNASFALGEVRWGMIPAGGSHVRLPRAIPWNVAMEILLTGRPIDAQRAYEVGLVNRLVDAPADALPEAMRLAELVCENGPLAVQTCKEICVRAWEHERAFVLENALFQRVRTSEDAQEGPRSYMEKRKPQFTGR